MALAVGFANNSKDSSYPLSAVSSVAANASALALAAYFAALVSSLWIANSPRLLFRTVLFETGMVDLCPLLLAAPVLAVAASCAGGPVLTVVASLSSTSIHDSKSTSPQLSP